MNKPQNYTSKKLVTTFVSIAVLLSVLSITVSPALGDDDNGGDFLIPGNGYTVDYYKNLWRASHSGFYHRRSRIREGRNCRSSGGTRKQRYD